MASVFDPNQQPDPNLSQGQGSQNSAPPQGSNPPPTGAAPQQSGPAPQQQAAPQPASPKGTSSGRFSNINKYIQANQNNNYANKVGATIEGQAGQVRQGIESANQQAQQQFNPEQQRLQQAGQLTQQAFTDPTAFTQNQANVDAFNKVRQGQYGQVDTSNQADLQNQLQKAQSIAGQAGTEGGRYELLKQTFGQNKPYSSGQQRLDQLLLQGQGNELGKLNQQAQATSQGLGQQFGQFQTGVQGMNDQLNQMGKSAQQQAQEALTGKVTSEQQRLQGAADQLQAQRESQFSGLQQGLQKGELTEEQAKMIGLDPTQGDVRLWNAKPTDLLNQQALGKVGVGNVATDEDRARLQALTKLGGDQSLNQFAAAGPALNDVGKTFNTDTFNQQRAGSEAEGLGAQGYMGNLGSMMENQGRIQGYQQTAQQAQQALNSGDYNKAVGLMRQVAQNADQGGTTLAGKGSLGVFQGGNFSAPNQQFNAQSFAGLGDLNSQLQKQADLWGAEAGARQGSIQNLQNQTGYNNMLKILRSQPQQGA